MNVPNTGKTPIDAKRYHGACRCDGWSCLMSRGTARSLLEKWQDHMTIPWATALHLVKKLLPLVIDKAPQLLITFIRFLPLPSTQDGAPSEPALVALQEQIDAHQRTIATQAETIVQLRTTLNKAQRSATIAWSVLAVMMLLLSL